MREGGEIERGLVPPLSQYRQWMGRCVDGPELHHDFHWQLIFSHPSKCSLDIRCLTSMLHVSQTVWRVVG